MYSRWGGQGDIVFDALAGDFMRPRINEVDELLARGVNVTVYNGQLDLICATKGTEAWVEKLKWDGLKTFLEMDRTPMFCGDGRTTKGFRKSYKNLHFYWILGAGHFNNQIQSTKLFPNDLETFLYDQTLDHFNYKPESYATFKQRYFINSKYWGGTKSSAPIFAYLGEESDLEGDLQVIGFLEKNAPHFKALILYIEHRFYGKSNPVGSMEKALKNITARSYFSSAQALADYAEILVYLKKTLSAQKSPIIVIGASYGGMLASWFRLKYPHIALGALASSAPILYFEDITPQDGYYSVVTKDFQEESESCYMTIKESWAEIDRIASKPDGLSILSQRFKTCTPLTELSELIDYLDTGYAGAAQYNSPSRNPVHKLCGGIDGTATGADILDKIFAGVVARSGNSSCYNMTSSFSNDTLSGWGWQTCSEMVMPIGITKKDSIYPPAPFLLSEFINDCKKKYGITPRPHWITTYYGGHDIKLVLSKFASNIIFSNGLKDPYSSGGVLEDISDSVLAITAVNGSHCLDVLTEREDDPEWLINQRAIEVTIIKGWIKKYYQDLRASQK